MRRFRVVIYCPVRKVSHEDVQANTKREAENIVRQNNPGCLIIKVEEIL